MGRVISLPLNLKANPCYQECTSDSLKYPDLTDQKQGEVYGLSGLLQGYLS